MKENTKTVAYVPGAVTVAFLIMLSFVVGMLFGMNTVINNMRSAGIDHIEQCHNVSSNWYEIVWTDERR